ncbi:MAG: glycosyltransferase family 9 protein [Bacteroidetes bacterium]|nr:MAG: glycosyltransferase family 9 protein [Bacteroidota bacterium]
MKLLVIRFSSIGDLVLTTPVVRCLKAQTGAEIHFLTKKNMRPILEHNPYIDRIFTLEKDLAPLLPQLKKQDYDHVVDLHKNLRSWLVKMRLRRPALSFDKINFEKWLMVRFKIDRLPEVHLVDRYFEGLRPLGIQNDGRGLDWFLPPGLELPVSLPRPFIAFAIGAAHATKRVPVEKAISICQKIKYPVALIGGADVADDGDTIARKSGAHIRNLCGRLSLHESALIIRESARVLTHDTGMMHIAAAFRKPVTSLWGNTIPKFGMYPYYPAGMNLNTTVEVAGLPCRPCSKIGHTACPRVHFKCMRDLPEALILETLSGLGDD